MIQKADQKSVSKPSFGEAIHVRPFLDQHQRFDDYMDAQDLKSIELKTPRLKKSDHARNVFEAGLDALGYAKEEVQQ